MVGELVPRRAPGSRSRRPRARRSTSGAPPGIRSLRFRSPGGTSCARSPPARSTATRRSSSWWRRPRGSRPNGQRDLLMAYEMNGAVVTGFPPNTSGASGCVTDCNITGGFDQNLALGDLDGDGVADIAAPHDNAYLSIHDQDGWMHDAAAVLPGRRQGRRHPLPARPRARAAGLAEQSARRQPGALHQQRPGDRRSRRRRLERARRPGFGAERRADRPPARRRPVAARRRRRASPRLGGAAPPLELSRRAVGFRRQHRRHHQPGFDRRSRSAELGARDRLRRLRRQDLRRAARSFDRLELRVHERRHVSSPAAWRSRICRATAVPR